MLGRTSPALRVLACRAYSQKTGSTTTAASSGPAKTPQPAGVNANVPGLSSKCVRPAGGPVGPGAAENAAYKVPEYFCFDRFSYAEAEVEMAQFRCPQPTANRKK